MASDRGEYTPIPSVLLDGKDFQKLSERANHLFLVLKINMGPTGIEVHYPQALAIQLSAQTRMPVSAVDDCMDELEAGDWIRREANIIWVVEHLRYHPNMKPALEKHRTGVQNYVKGLPRLAIVGEFVRHYKDYFVDVNSPDDGYPSPEDSLSNAYAMPTESRSTQYAGRNTQTQDALGAAQKSRAAPKGTADVVPISSKRGTRLSESWQPTQQHRDHATRLGVDVELEAEKFRDHAKAQGRVAKDWEAAFRNWLRKAPEMSGRRRQDPNQKLIAERQRIESIDLESSKSVFNQ